MRNARELLIWTAVGVLGAVLLAWGYPRLFPLLPGDWEIDRQEATAIALERLRDLGELPADPYLVVRLRSDLQLERRLQLLAAEIDPELLRRSEPAEAQLVWDVLVYTPGANPGEWSYRAWITRDGEVLTLRRGQTPNLEGDPPDPAVARRQAEELLADHGFDLAAFEPEPEVRNDADGASTTVRFRRPDPLLGDQYPYGSEVYLEAGEPLGFGFWFDDARRDELRDLFRQAQLVTLVRTVFFYFLLPLVAIPFLRRYHDGQLGVRRGVQFFLVSMVAGTVLLILDARIFSEGVGLGFLSRAQATWVVAGFTLMFQFLGLAVLGLMSWSVGESLCRGRWPQKLASIDALFRLKWANATVARSSLRGYAAGVAMAGVLVALGSAAQSQGAWGVSGFIFSNSGLDSSMTALATLTLCLSYTVPLYLFVCLLVPCWAVERLGPTAGMVLASAVAIFISPILLVLPLPWGWAMWAVVAAVPVLLVRFGDLLSALLSALVFLLTVTLAPTFFAADASIQLHGLAAMLVAAAPLVVSLRYLGSGQEFTYTYDDVPPHVRRIAERERQRMELETARNIQSSILPHLPAQLNGVEIAHSYLPASEVGGDFYDVLALDDGRLAVAVGDVAGHGVSSGLVMSAAKSALAVQVTFDPGVESVLRTLNRMVYQSARRRLLSTLCYAILDPRQHELYYASAGHVFPYRVAATGEVEPLFAGSYPLGVRGDIDVRVRTAKLADGDAVFMYSDGLVEATAADGSDEPFGFERLEASLRRHAAKPPAELRDAVLAEVEEFTSRRAREDDVTVLVLRLPAA
jgi:hypothetical protein